MVVIVVVCAAFGITASEAKTENMCLRTTGMPEPIAMFNIEAAGHVYNPKTNSYTSRGTSTLTRTVLLAGFVAHMKVTRQPTCVMFGELMGSAVWEAGQEKE